MFVRSTGLGRTLLQGRIAKIVATDINPSTLEEPPKGSKEPMRLLMEMEIQSPVHWTVRAFVDPPDLREMLKYVITNPSLLLTAVKFLFMKGPKYDTLNDEKKATDTPKIAASTSSPPVSGGQPGPGLIPVRKK
jgi:hypothetical protein